MARTLECWMTVTLVIVALAISSPAAEINDKSVSAEYFAGSEGRLARFQSDLAKDSGLTPAQRIAWRQEEIAALSKSEDILAEKIAAQKDGPAADQLRLRGMLAVERESQLRYDVMKIESERSRIDRIQNQAFVEYVLEMGGERKEAYYALILGVKKDINSYRNLSDEDKKRVCQSSVIAKMLDEAGTRDENVREFYGLPPIDQKPASAR